MSIYSSSVKRPVTTILIFIGLMVIGLYSLVQLPVDLYPEIELPFVTVMTTYPGASASDIESNVTRPIEDVLNSVSNLKDLTSTSSDGLSVIFLNFEYGSNLDEAIMISGVTLISLQGFYLKKLKIPPLSSSIQA